MAASRFPRTYHPDRPASTAERQQRWRAKRTAELHRLRQLASAPAVPELTHCSCARETRAWYRSQGWVCDHCGRRA